jgi:uncharacterized Zn-finger protein
MASRRRGRFAPCGRFSRRRKRDTKMSTRKQRVVGISGHDSQGKFYHFECPEVQGEVVNGQIVVQCPYCTEAHAHVGEIGHRLSHCWHPRALEISDRGYLIFVRGGRTAEEYEFPAVEADIVEGQAIIRCPYCAEMHYHGASAGYHVAPCSGADERRGYAVHIEGSPAESDHRSDPAVP